MSDAVASAAILTAASVDLTQGKVLLALVSAIFGWGVKTVWDEYKQRQRFRRLAPMVLRQLRSAAVSLGGGMDLVGIPRAVAKLTAAQATAIELVAAGISVSTWLTGLTLIADCLDAAQDAQTVPADQRPAAMKVLRESGDALGIWSNHLLKE